jgi:alanine racemase
MQHSHLYSTWAEIDLKVIGSNIQHCCKHTGAQVMAVVKANAYGHGLAPIAQEAMRSGASWLGMARPDEALELRRSGLNGSILLMGYTPPGQYAEAIANWVSLTVWSFDQVQAASAAARLVGEPARIHIKVDSGMSRLGVQPEDALDLARAASTTEGIVIEGLCTHFARADEADPTPTDIQEQRFNDVLQAFDAAGLRPPLVHAANSAAGLTRPSACFNLVRAGIAIYGMHPSPECPLPSEFRPALAWKATLSQVKMLPPGRGVSYGHVYTTKSSERIGTVPVGYADGYRRVPGNWVLVGGCRVPVVGRVSMDQIMLQLDAVPEAQTGDEVVLIGAQGKESITAEEVAERWGTINFEVTCGIAARVYRLYT